MKVLQVFAKSKNIDYPKERWAWDWLILCLYAPKELIQLRKVDKKHPLEKDDTLPELGTNPDFVLDIYDIGVGYHATFAKIDNNAKWDLSSYERYAGRLNLIDLLYQEEVLIEKGSYQWIIEKRELDLIRNWLLLHVPPLALKSIEPHEFGIPA